MHELTISYQIIKTAEQQMQSLDAKITTKQVKALFLEVGELAAIDIDALKYSFSIASANSLLRDATLEINIIPGKAWCECCQKEIKIKTLFQACPGCDKYHYQIQQGKELKILRMEVV